MTGRMWLAPPDLEELYARISAEVERQRSLRELWLNRSESLWMADRLGRRYQQAPFMPADALVAATLAGVDDEAFGALAEASGIAGMERGGLIDAAQLADYNKAQQAEVDHWMEVAKDAFVAKDDGGLWKYFKGATRATVGTLQSGYEAVQNAAASRVHGIADLGGELLEGDIGGAVRASGAAFGYQALMPSTYQATTAGQTVSQFVDTGEVDTGTGFFVGGATAEDVAAGRADQLGVAAAQAQRARDVRGTIDGHAWTIGRATASTVLQPGSQPYNWVSGTLDFASSLGLDPVNFAGAGVAKGRRLARVATDVPVAQADLLAQASRAAAAGDDGAARALLKQVDDMSGVTKAARQASAEWRAAVEETVGMLPGRGGRNAVYTPKAMRWVLSDKGRKVVEAVAAETSPTALWLRHGKKIEPGDALALAEANTDKAVIAAYGQAFSTGHLRDLPTPGHWSGSNLPGMKVTTRFADRWRLWGQFPNTYLDPDDPSAAFRAIYDTLGNAKIVGAERAGLMDGWIRAKATGLRGEEYHAVHEMSSAIGKRLVAAGADDDTVRKVTDWHRAYGRQVAWLSDEFADGISSDFLGQAGPTRLIEALSSGTWLMDPAEIRGVRQLTSRVGRINRKFKVGPIAESFVSAMQQKIWKPLVLIRPAYLARVNGEEVVRAMMGGEFRHASDLLLAMTGHGQGDDLFSNVIRKVGGRYASDITGDPFDLGKMLNKMDEDVDAAKAAGHTDEVERLLTERGRIGDRIRDGFEGDYKRALVGRVRSKATGITLRDDFVNEYGIRTGNWVKVDKGQREWLDGLADELRKLHQDKIARRVANGGLLPADNPSQFRPGLDGIEDWIIANGDGVLDELTAMYPDINWADPQNARKWVDQQVADVAHHTGNNGKVRQMVASGRLGDAAAFTPDKSGKIVAGKEVRRFLGEWQSADDAPAWVRWEQTLADPNRSVLLKRSEQYREQLVGWFFGELYGRSSDYLARSPSFRKFYWQRVDELSGTLTAGEAQKALAKLDAAKLPKDATQRIGAKLRVAHGTEKLDDIDLVAKGWALDETNKLLMEAGRKSQFFDVAKIGFPFGEAWKEVLTTWTRTAYQRPEIVNSLRKTVVAGREGDPDNNGQGFFLSNSYGEEVFIYPMSGRLAEFVTGVNVHMEGSLLGLSMGTQVFPGIGPVAAFAVGSLVPDSPTFDGVSRLLFPYGEPSERDQDPLEIALPGWMEKVGARIPAVRDWFGFDNPAATVTYGNTLVEVYSALSASGDYNLKDPQDLDRLDRDARRKAKDLSALRGLIQAVGPSSPSLVYKVNTLEGDVVTAKFAEELRKLQDEDYDTAVARFLDRFGEGAMIYLASKSELANPGVAPTEEWDKWVRDHGGLIEKYPTVGAFFGPQGVEFSIDVYNQQIRAGQRTRRTPNERLAEANNLVARSIYYTAKEKMPPNPTPEQDAWLAEIREELAVEYPGFVLAAEGQVKFSKQLAELEQATNDREVQRLPVGEALILWFDVRDRVLAAQVEQGVSTSTTRITSAKKGRHLREHMRVVADELTAKYGPEFGRLYEDVLSRELTDEVVEEVAA